MDENSRETIQRGIEALERQLSGAAPSPEALGALRAALGALQESEERSQRIFAEAPVGMATVNSESRLMRVNRAFCEMLGYIEADLVGRSTYEITDPADHPAMRERVRECQSTPGFGRADSFKAERRFVHRDGHIVRGMMSVSLIREPDGRPPYGIIQVQDLTERLSAEEDLRESENRFHSAFQYAPVGMMLVNVVGRILRVNRAFGEMLGYTENELAGRSTYEITPAGQHAEMRARQTAREAGNTEEYQTERCYLHRTGRIVRGKVRVSFVRGSESSVPYGIVHVEDITERRRVEEALRESEERFQKAFEHAPVAMGLATVEGGALRVNQALCSMFGYSEDELIGASPFIMSLPEDRGEVAARLGKLKSGERSNYRVEKRYLRKDGEIVWGLTSASVLRDAEGHPRYLIVQIEDITELKRAEERARQRQAELSHVLRVHTMGEMASGLAHELNQPLGAIVGFAKGCERRCRAGELETADLVQNLDHIAEEALRAGEIIRRLRRMLRKEPARLERVDLNELVRHVADLVASEAQQNRIGMHVDLDPSLGPIDVDAVQIEQVILNLVRNGLDAIRDCANGERLLVIRTAMRGIEMAEVVVRDSGGGIPAEQMERVFEPFYTTKGTGLGMGLCISRSIIEAHHGRVWIEPGVERGAVVGFTVPVAREVPDAE